MAVALKRLEYDLREQIHEVKEEWHTTCHTSQCLGPVMDNYIEKVIELTEEIDETREKLDEPLELEY